MKRVIIGVAAALVLVGAAEIGVRMLGMVDFPLYDANNKIGYILKPNQSGSFLDRNDWDYNELSMGTSKKFSPDKDKDILLIGDSIVLGGNPYRQNARLGPQLEDVIKRTVWPISAGSWGLQNELEYLRENPDVVANVKRIIFISNSGDFDKPSSWASEFTHPREYPRFALFYLFQKYLLQPHRETPPDLQVTAADPVPLLRDFATAYGKDFDMWIYPDRAESADPAEWHASFDSILARLNQAVVPGLKLHIVDKDHHWRPEDYRDDIHPTPEATTKLATEIAGGTPAD